jgi:hypothetical protein
VAPLGLRVQGEPLRPGAAAFALVAAAAAAFLVVTPPAPAQQAPPHEAKTLARFAFEDDATEPGDATLRAFATGRERVARSYELVLEGASSVELEDEPCDHDFPELLGEFPRVSRGVVRAHFGVLTARAEDAWNVALAGPSRFVNRKDGIAFRLEARDGILRHHSDSIPKKLFPLDPYRWYVVDLVYRVDEGTYDLTIREPGRTEPLVSLEEQPNATSSAGSSVEVFSFVGDVDEDASATDLFVDDVAISVSER